MGLSQSEPRFDDAFSDEETSGYTESPTRQSYRTLAASSKYIVANATGNRQSRIENNRFLCVCFQVTAAQVEIYTTKSTVQTAEPMDSSHSASPTATWSSRKQITDNNAIREIDPAHGRSEGKYHNF